MTGQRRRQRQIRRALTRQPIHEAGEMHIQIAQQTLLVQNRQDRGRVRGWQGIL
jgi:hypothetical protein